MMRTVQHRHVEGPLHVAIDQRLDGLGAALVGNVLGLAAREASRFAPARWLVAPMPLLA